MRNFKLTMNKVIFIVLLVSTPGLLTAQNTDTVSIIKNSIETTAQDLNINKVIKSEKRNPALVSFIIPATLIIYGFVALGNNSLKTINSNTKSELREDHPAFITKIDNYLQYTPAAAVYTLNAVGIKGKNNFRDRTMIYAMTTIISTASITSLKHIFKVERPDGSGNNSFPSGHTATAFASAEFLRMEYKDVSPWYGVAGYITAVATGVLRLYNNKHWINDIAAGAGFGILSTKLAYWIYPVVKRKFFKDKMVNTMIIPYYQAGNTGLSMVYHFHP